MPTSVYHIARMPVLATFMRELISGISTLIGVTFSYICYQIYVNVQRILTHPQVIEHSVSYLEYGSCFCSQTGRSMVLNIRCQKKIDKMKLYQRCSQDCNLNIYNLFS